MLDTHLRLHVALDRRTNGRSLGTSKKATLLRKSESTRQKSASTTNSKECSGRSTTDTTDTPDKSGKTVVTTVVSAGAQWHLRHHVQRCTTFRQLTTSANFYFRKFRVNFVAYYQVNTESHFVHNCSLSQLTAVYFGLRPGAVPSRSSLLWDVRRSRLVGGYRHFGNTVFKGQAVKEQSPQYTQ